MRAVSDADPLLAVGGWIVGTGEGRPTVLGIRRDASKPCMAPSLALRGAGSERNGLG